MATLTELRLRVSAKLGLDNTASPGDQGLIDSWISEGVTDFLLQTRCKIESGTTTLAAGQGDFTLDDDILVIEDMQVAGATQNYSMQPVGVHEILAFRQSLSVAGAGPLYYAVAGDNLLMVWPPPASTTTLVVYYVPRPVALTSGTSPTEIPLEFHKAVELFALAEGADYDDDQTSAQGQRYREQYDLWVMKARKYRNLKGGSRFPAARLQRRGRYASSRRDVY